MIYTFKEMLNGEVYDSTRVMFVFGKYNIFNNMVSDELKAMCIDDDTFNTPIEIGEEFGLEEDTASDNYFANSVDFNTFMDVIGVSSINGKWYCKADLGTLTKKQKEKLLSYIKEPSENGILVISSNDWMVYKDFLKNRTLSFSKSCHIMQLSFPSKDVLKVLVKQLFEEEGIDIQPSAIDFFMIRMSEAYDDYEDVIRDIKNQHKSSVLEVKDLKVYMKGIENFVVDDFIKEIVKPMASDKTNSKKVLKIMMALEDDMGAKNLLYQVLKIVDECIEYRLLINQGYIPIGINYFFKDIIEELGGKDGPYGNVKEWTFRKKASLASMTSLKDWEYMKIILSKAIENVEVSDVELDNKCQKALYELCTRSVITSDRLNNIIGVDNILAKDFDYINKIEYNEESLKSLQEQ